MFGGHNFDIGNYLTETGRCDLTGGNVSIVDVELIDVWVICIDTMFFSIYGRWDRGLR